MNGDRLQHAIGIQPHRTAPQLRFQDVVKMLALALFTGLDQKPCPFKRAQNARREGSHFAPSRSVPIMVLAVEGSEQRPLGGAIVGLNVDDVYWAKLLVGKAPSPDLLPAARPGDQLFWTKDGEVRAYSKPRASLEQIPRPQVRIPREHVHGLIRGAKAHYENSRPVDDGAYLKPFKKLLVDITSSKACLDKALGFANDLFNAFESVGHRATISTQNERFRRAAVDEREVHGKLRDPYYHTAPGAPYRPTVVYVGSVAIGLALVEMSEEVLLRYVRGKYIRDADYIPPKPSRLAADHTWTTSRALPSGRLRLVSCLRLKPNGMNALQGLARRPVRSYDRSCSA